MSNRRYLDYPHLSIFITEEKTFTEEKTKRATTRDEYSDPTDALKSSYYNLLSNLEFTRYRYYCSDTAVSSHSGECREDRQNDGVSTLLLSDFYEGFITR